MALTSIVMREYGSNWKSASVGVHSADLNAGNIAAQTAAAIALKDAIDTVTLGGIGITEISLEVDNDGLVAPADEQAQREVKWLVSARETTSPFLPVTFTIPTADLEQLATDGENLEDGAAKAALVAAIEAFVLSVRGAAVSVESIKYRSRSR